MIQPAGDILVFAPTAELSVPARPDPAHTPLAEQPILKDARAVDIFPSYFWDLADYPTETSMRVPGTPSVRDAVSPPGAADPGAELEQEAAFFAPSPASQTPGNVYPGSATPLAQPLGNVYPGVPGQAGLQAGPGLLAAGEINTLLHPLPLRVSLSGLAAGALLLLALVFLNPDWATGATVSGLVAVIFALLLLIAAGVRVALGLLAQTNPRRRVQVLSSALLVLTLFFFAGLGLSQQTDLHAMQARFLEGQQNWQAAVSEYQAAGEVAPVSENLARTYVEWGEHLSRQQQYGDAVNRFATVLSQYMQVTDQVRRARSDLIAAYLAWATGASRHQDYAGAAAHYDALLASGYCDSSCQSLTQPEDATTYDQLAAQQLAAQQYAPAVAAFKALTTRFPASPQAGRVHADYARALWGLGQQQVGTTCAAAVSPYQQLAMQFADTTEGRQAAAALKQPVQAKGRFTQGVPDAPNQPTVFLVQGLVVGIHQYQFPPLLRTAPTAQIQADGTFAFPSVPPGIYELVWSSDGALHFYYAFSGNQVLYTAHVGPLCAYDFGNVNQAIPSGNG
jgi:tetratricopeptide (TPR) repeat protein